MTPLRPFAGLWLALILAFAGVAPALAQAPAAALTAAPDPVHIELAAPDGRKIDVSLWRAPDERGVVVFSHGHGGQPAAYRRIINEWVAAGFTVAGPLHPDSLVHPDRASFNGPMGFMARVTDLAVVRGYLKVAHPGRPLVAAGHSYGSLLSMMAGGAQTIAGPQADPDVRAVIAFSSAGDVRGLVTPATWPALTVPTLMITGDADLVDGFVSDWRAHRSPFDQSPAGDKLLLVFAGGDHSLVRNAEPSDFDLMVRTTTDFMLAHGLGDTAAAARLSALAPLDGVTIEKR